MRTAPTTRSPHRLAWLGLLAPPLAWALQLAVGYAFEEAGCGRPDSSLWGAGIDTLTASLVVACGIVAFLGGVVSLFVLLGRGDDERGIRRFLAVAGLLGSIIFLLAIVLSGVAVASLNGCSAG